MRRAILREALFAVAAAVLGCAALRPEVVRVLRGTFHFVARLLEGWWKTGAVTALILFVVALSYPLRALHAARKPEGESPIHRLGALCAAATALGAGATWWAVRGFRWTALHAVSGPSFGTWVNKAFLSFEEETWFLAIVADLVVCLALLWAAVAIASARRRGAVASAAVIAPAVVAGLAAMALLRAEVAAIGWSDPCGAPDRIFQLRYEAFIAHGAPLAVQPWILLAAVAGTAVIVALARREGSAAPPDRMAWAASGSLFAAGIVAFALTRDAAHDTANPPPLWETERRAFLDESEAVLPPVAAHSGDMCEGPMLRLHPRGWMVNGVLSTTPEAVSTALGEIPKMWEQVYPQKPFPRVVAALIPPETPMRAVLPMIEAARRAGYAEVRALGRIPGRQWQTRTLGEVAYAPRLGCVMLPASLPEDGTWGDLVARTGQ